MRRRGRRIALVTGLLVLAALLSGGLALGGAPGPEPRTAPIGAALHTEPDLTDGSAAAGAGGGALRHGGGRGDFGALDVTQDVATGDLLCQRLAGLPVLVLARAGGAAPGDAMRYARPCLVEPVPLEQVRDVILARATDWMGPDPGSLTVRVERRGVHVQSAVIEVHVGERRIHHVRTGPEPPAPLRVPAGVPLRVAVVGEWWLDVTGAGFPPARGLTVESGHDAEVAFELGTGTPVRFQVVDPEGHPTPAAIHVRRDRGAQAPASTGLAVLPDRSDERGSRHFAELAPGAYLVHVRPEQYATSWHRFVLPYSDVPIEVDLRAASTADPRHHLRVVDSTGAAAMAGSTLSLVSVGGTDYPSYAGWRGVLDPNGRAETPPLPPGDYRLLDWQAHRACLVTLPPDGSEVVVTVAPHRRGDASIEGRLAGGAELPGAVWVHARSDGDPWTYFVGVDRHGRFAIRGLAPGRTELFVPFSWGSWMQPFHDYRVALELHEGRATIHDVALAPR